MAKKKPVKKPKTRRRDPAGDGRKAKPAGLPGKFNSTFIRQPDKITDEATGRTLLIDAILAQDEEKIARLLEAGASPNKAAKDGKSPLHHAARLGYFTAVELLLDAGAALNPRDKNLATPLFEALACPQPLGMLDLLLEAGANPDVPDADGKIPLHVAAESAAVPVIRQLIEATDNPNRPDNRGYQPLHRAAEKNTVEAVQAILFERVAVFSSCMDGDTALHLAAARSDSTAVADYLLTTEAAQLVNAVNLNGRSPLHLAVLYRHEALAQKMLDAGANVNLPDSQGLTPLHEAAEANNPRMARLLIDNGADVAKSQQLHRATPLILAIKAGAAEIVGLLLQHNADPCADDAQGATPLMAAAAKPNDAIVGTLLGAGADARVKDKLGRNVLQYCAPALSPGMMGKLVDAGAEVNNRDTWQRTPLLSAIIDHNMPLARKLLEKGADPNLKDEGGNAPLLAALNYRKLEIVEDLLKNGADANIRDRWSNQTALALCCSLNLDGQVGTLIDYGGDVNAKDNAGKTPLHVAVQNSYSSADTVRTLLKKGADPLLPDASGHTPYDMAHSLDKFQAVQAIQDHLKAKGIDAKPTRYNPWGGGGFGGGF